MLVAALAVLAVAHSPATVDAYAATRLDCPAIAKWRPYAPRERRHSDRRRVARACRKLGASRDACLVLDAIVVRESSGDGCAVHVLGKDEFGLGALGLSVGLHLAKWRAGSRPDVLRIPEVSAVVGVRIFRRAVVRYGARSWREVGGVFAGRRYEDGDEFLFCRRLARAGVDCEADPRGQLGELLGREPEAGQDAFVLRLLAAGTRKATG